MQRRYVFADESGDFVFANTRSASRYFIVCTVEMDSCDVGTELLALRRKLIWDGAPLRDFFHETNDAQIVRDAVFNCIAGLRSRHNDYGKVEGTGPGENNKCSVLQNRLVLPL